jgi:ubiquinone/menaquinone biosynthesis C-methylase UbiE
MAVFDQYAEEYDDWYDDTKGSFVDKVETELTFKLLEVKKGMKVLDFDCGTGSFSIKLAKMGCKVTGIDVPEEMLKIARAKAIEQNLDIEFIQSDINGLAFAYDNYEAVVSMATFEFIEHPSKTLTELFRVVKSGGKVIVGTIAKDSEWGKLYESEDARNNSVFKYATFLTLQDLMSWEKDKLIETGECLFIHPLVDEDEFCVDRENELTGERKGGFVCALWKR